MDAALYTEYSWDYQITPTWIESVSRRRPRRFVTRGDGSALTFERDAAGTVARLVLHLDNDDLVGVEIR